MSDHTADSHNAPGIPPWRNDLREILDDLTLSEKLRLIEEVARSLHQSPTHADLPDLRENLDRLRSELAVLPVCNPADGFCNRDHDDQLYGGRQ